MTQLGVDLFVVGMAGAGAREIIRRGRIADGGIEGR